MSDQDDAVTFYRHDDEPGRRLWEYDGADNADRPAEAFTGLVNLGFIRTALRRSVRLWCTTAVVGLLIGLAVFMKFPASYQASTTLLLPPPAYSNAITDDQLYAQSRTVAGLALSQLGSQQNAAALVSHSTITTETGRVLLITVKEASASQAILEANALATAFLTFQANLLKTQAQLVNATLQQQISQARQQVDSASNETQRSQATTALDTLEQTATANEATTQVATDAAIKGSQVLDKATAAPQHAKKRLLLYAGGGLLAGLVLGMGIVVIRGLTSDRLRRRDEVATALGAPVKLSVGTVRAGSRLSRRRGLAVAQRPEAQKIVGYLGNAIATSSRGPASLAAIPIGDVDVPAACLVSLALARAQQGLQVVLADLCPGAPSARLLGVTSAGIQPVSSHDTQLIVVVPDAGDAVPTGPLGAGSVPGVAEPLADACKSADLLLTLVALDPSLGADHLTGWARSVVAVVSAGQASASRIHAVGEMIRLAGTPMFSGVLVGADKTDESLGLVPGPGAGRGLITREGFTF